MFMTPEQFSAASKASLEAHLSLINNLTSKAFDSVGKLAELNLAVARTSFEESKAAVAQLAQAKDAQEWFSFNGAYAQPATEKAQSYLRHLAGIACEAHAEFTKATGAHITESSRRAMELMEELAKNAPAGSENAIALAKSVIGNASDNYEQFSKSAQQATETLEANLNNVVAQFKQGSKSMGPIHAKK
jgi:phasin family protein